MHLLRRAEPLGRTQRAMAADLRVEGVLRAFLQAGSQRR
jgi:hypothetical protein